MTQEPVTPCESDDSDPVDPTRRATLAALEEILFHPFPVLDQGFVRVIDYMGNDQAVVQAARVSYGKGTRQTREDQGLIRYLMRHRHTTPFEMCEIKFHIKLPVFVARQWIRHRTASVNEYSARYSVMDDAFYVPDPDLMASQSQTNRQGRGEVLSRARAEAVANMIREDARQSYALYTTLLGESGSGEPGLARELARTVLPVNIYTQWYWKTDLHNLMHFLSLRADNHAQAEIRAYADVMMDVMARWVPLTFQAFQDYRVHARSFSGPALQVLHQILAGEVVCQEESGLTPREWRELMMDLGRDPEEGQHVPAV